MVRAPANYIRPFRKSGGGGGGVGGGGGGGGGGGRGGGGWNGWGPEPGNPWWGDAFDSGLMRVIFTLLTGAEIVNPTVEQNAADWEAIRDFVRAKARDLNNLYRDAPTTQGVYNSGGFAFINPGGIDVGAEGGLIRALAIAIGAGASAAASVAAASLAQLWGLVNGRPAPTAKRVFSPVPGTTPPEGNTIGATWTWRYGPITYRRTDASCLPIDTDYVAPGSPSGVSRPNVVAVSGIRYIAGTCGLAGREITLKFASGEPDEVFSLGKLGGGAAYTKFEGPEEFIWAGPGAVPFVDKPPGGQYPDTVVVPQFQPEPAVKPAWAPVVPLPYAPPAVPEGEPVEEPGVAPTTPGPTAPPATAPQVPAPVVPAPVVPLPLPDAEPTQDGSIVPKPTAPVVVTRPDAHFPVPGGPPVTGNGPRPTPAGISQELGRLEQKLARLSNPGPGGPGDGTDRLQLLFQVMAQLYEFMTAINAGGSYTLSSPCELDENGNRVVVPVDFSGAISSFGVLSNKLDALAQLLQVHKDLKQPNCSTKPVLTGEWVTVNFQSDEASSGGERPLRKVLRYRDQTAAPLETHLAHWESFAWDAGRVIVISKNLDWGTPQVWAASAAEGKRVLSHAAQMAGVDLTDPKHEWIVTGSNDPRYGRTGRMRLDTRGGKFMRVTSRPGPSGLPSGFSPDS